MHREEAWYDIHTLQADDLFSIISAYLQARQCIPYTARGVDLRHTAILPVTRRAGPIDMRDGAIARSRRRSRR